MANRFPELIRQSSTASYLLALFAFFLPISTSATAVLAIILLVVWILEGNFRERFLEIINNKFVLAVLGYITLHIVALLWTSDWEWGLRVAKSQWKLLMLPIFLTQVQKKHKKLYVQAFLAAMLLSVACSYLAWLGLVSFKHATIASPTPFINKIEYNPFLAFATYLLLQVMLSAKNLPPWHRLTYIILLILMSINMFITDGRTGQIAFLVLTIVSLLQLVNKKNIKKILLAASCLPIFLFLAFQFSTNFRNRCLETIDHTTNFYEKPKTSTGQRLTFIINTIELIKQNPLAGVGTGDYKEEYAKINQQRSPSFPSTVDPHNQYLAVLAQFGLLGFLILLNIFYQQMSFIKNAADNMNNFRVAFMLFIGTIFLGGSYLTHHHGAFLFVLGSAILFKHEITSPLLHDHDPKKS